MSPQSKTNGKSAEKVTADVTQPQLSFGGWLRWLWRQLTSMRTALILLLLLAVAAVPGSLVPQRSSDPNGVTQYFADNPDLAPWLDKFQFFDVYSSAWFSAVYILLFISLIGCVVPRIKHHFDALRSQPPKTPVNLNRLPAHAKFRILNKAGGTAEQVLAAANESLKSQRYRVVRYDQPKRITVSAERGYLRETGNLIFHSALVGVLLAVGFGSGFGYSGQRVIVEGQAFTNTLLAYDSFNPGRFFTDSALVPYSITLDKFSATYESSNQHALGQATDYTADVTTQLRGGNPETAQIKVNAPLQIGGTDVYLLGNGYAPTITVRDPNGNVVFADTMPFLPQDKNLTSLGVVKLPDGLAEQLGMIGFLYPTVATGHGGASFSQYPELIDPQLAFDVYQGDLGLNSGVPRSVYSLDTSKMTKIAGRKTNVEALELKPGETAQLPNGLGSVTFDGIKRFASLDIHHDPAQGWVLGFALLSIAGLLVSLFIPRRRMWAAVTEARGGFEVELAGLARGDDPSLDAAVARLKADIESKLGLTRD